MIRKKDNQILTFLSRHLNSVIWFMIWIFMWSEEPEIKSKQASKRNRTLNFRMNLWSHRFSQNMYFRAEILTIAGSHFRRNDDFINSFWSLRDRCKLFSYNHNFVLFSDISVSQLRNRHRFHHPLCQKWKCPYLTILKMK